MMCLECRYITCAGSRSAYTFFASAFLSNTAFRHLLRKHQASAAQPDANNTIVDGSGFCTTTLVEEEAAMPVNPTDVPVRKGERGIVVVTVDWIAVDVLDVRPGMLMVLVVVPAAVKGLFVVVRIDPFPAAGRSVPPAASGNRDAAVPLVGDVKGWTVTARGAEAPARGNGLKTLVPVGGVGGALPTSGDGLKVVGEVANGAAAPNKGNGLNGLPPVVAFPWGKIDVTVVCCTVTACA
jgi:hypothetical protein